MDVETASVHSETASDFSEYSRASTAPSTAVSTAASSATTHSAHPFTCLACHVAFRTAENQREHMRSDWHRYNLKRKVADIPPVTAENFAARVQQQQQQQALQNAGSRKEGGGVGGFVAECAACKKSYSNENGYTNHLNSKKHKETQAKFDANGSEHVALPTTGKRPAPVVSGPTPRALMPTPTTASSSSSSDPAAAPVSWRRQLADAETQAEVLAIMERKAAATERLTELDCLFCSQRCQTFENNLAHMARAHSFFIPDMEFLVDLKGLIAYLGEKIAVAHVCLYCNGKGRAYHSLEAVRKHMLDKGHCKILYEDGAELEVADFYDFSSTYPDEVAEDDEDDDNAEWEDVDDETDETTPSSSSRGRAARPTTTSDSDSDSELGDLTSHPLSIHLTPDETQLVLPSGQLIGHRSYNKFWKQSLKPLSSNNDSVVINQLMGQYRQLGYTSTPYEVAVAHHERRMQAKKAMRKELEFKARTGQKHNKLQKHFRSQIGFGV
ncbi:C2H2 type zinc-finger-domain-containing protein [Fimicolochytrium jonesii]|uniref:C2H2 type zinc-finger-domain-containing protein n=1 Tax=Fimicolochytrium jonesii TaxID=1396493 RepID=UPI0022FE96AB|nr:C2H2 type zinc-finger-domain-containing protein [Fimicolochytrium jonesii]KAI8826549.1 C2H2 type zinc-finger-domain-containing protein [Fimicolochytrium jonesii]